MKIETNFGEKELFDVLPEWYVNRPLIFADGQYYRHELSYVEINSNYYQ